MGEPLPILSFVKLPVLGVFKLAPPPDVLNVPFDRVIQGLVELPLGTPAQSLDLAAIEGIAAVVAGPVGDGLNQVFGFVE